MEANEGEGDESSRSDRGPGEGDGETPSDASIADGCPSCRASVPAESRFCTSCGADLKALETDQVEAGQQAPPSQHADGEGDRCQACGAESDADHAFCTSCGAPMAATADAAAEHAPAPAGEDEGVNGEDPDDDGSPLLVAGIALLVLLAAAAGYWLLYAPSEGIPGPWEALDEMHTATLSSPDHLPAEADRLAEDGEAAEIFAFVRDEIQTLPPSDDSFEEVETGVRWGVNGTLRGGAGTPREQAQTLVSLYEEAGYEAEVVSGQWDASEEEIERMLHHRPSHAFSPDSQGRDEAWKEGLGVEDISLDEEDFIDPGGELTREAAERMRGIVQRAMSGDTGAFGQGLGSSFEAGWGSRDRFPVVRVAVDGEERLASPATPWLDFGEHPHVTRTTTADFGPGGLEENEEVEPVSPSALEPAAPAGELLTVTVSLEAHQRSPEGGSRTTTLVEGNWTADELVGNQLRVRTTPIGEPHQVLGGSFADVEGFIPMLGIKGIEGQQNLSAAFVGEPYHTDGEKVDVAELSYAMGIDPETGELVGETAGGDDVDQITIPSEPDASEFRDIELEVNATGLDGDIVEGLSKGDLVVEEEGRRVNAQIEDRNRVVDIPLVLTIAEQGDWTDEEIGDFLDDFRDEVKERVPTASEGLLLEETDIENQTAAFLWRNAVEAAKEQPHLIVYFTDGYTHDTSSLYDEVPEVFERGPPIVFLNIAGEVTDTQEEIAQLSGGDVVAAKTPDEALENIVPYLDFDDLALPYRVTYSSPTPGFEERTVRVSTPDGEVSAETAYTPPPPENRTEPVRLVGLDLDVEVSTESSYGGTQVSRTLAGYDPDTHPPRHEVPPERWDGFHDETLGALFGTTMLHFEGMGAPPSVLLADNFEAKASYEDVYHALNNTGEGNLTDGRPNATEEDSLDAEQVSPIGGGSGGDANATEEQADPVHEAVREALDAYGDVQVLPSEVLTLSSSLPERYEEGPPTYPTGLRTVLHHSQPVFDAEISRLERVDLLPTAGYRTAHADGETAFHTTLNRTAHLPVLEAGMFDVSTLSLLGDEELIPLRELDQANLSDADQRVWDRVSGEVHSGGPELSGRYAAVPADGDPHAYLTTTREGQLQALTVGLGDAGASLERTQQSLERWHKILLFLRLANLASMASDLADIPDPNDPQQMREYVANQAMDQAGVPDLDPGLGGAWDYYVKLGANYAMVGVVLGNLHNFKYDQATREKVFEESCKLLKRSFDLGATTLFNHFVPSGETKIIEPEVIEHNMGVIALRDFETEQISCPHEAPDDEEDMPVGGSSPAGGSGGGGSSSGGGSDGDTSTGDTGSGGDDGSSDGGDGDTSTEDTDATGEGGTDATGSGGGSGDGVDVRLTIEPREQDCPSGEEMCLVVTSGDASEIGPGTGVEVTYVNPAGNQEHSLHFVDHDDADHPDHEATSEVDAFASIEALPGGETTTTSFVVPTDADELYLWCDQADHEGQGMQLHP